MLMRNVAGQKIAVVALDINNIPIDDAAANVTAKISKDGGGMLATNDTNPAELSAADAAGVYLFDMTQAETDAGLLILQAVTTTSGVHFQPVNIYTDDRSLAAGAIKTTTFATGAIDAAAIATDAIGASEIADNAITASVIANNAIGSAQMAADAIDASALADDAVVEIVAGMNDPSVAEIVAGMNDPSAGAIADAVWNEPTADHVAAGSFGLLAADKTGFQLASDGVDAIVIETGINMRQAVSVSLASAAGKISGSETTTVTIKGANTSTTRISATVDANGNRTAITLTLP